MYILNISNVEGNWDILKYFFIVIINFLSFGRVLSSFFFERFEKSRGNHAIVRDWTKKVVPCIELPRPVLVVRSWL